MIGIYKITSPTERIYIGQSTNIEKRFKRYKALDCRTQTKLYKSLLKYGFENHIFEIIEICELNALNERERYWQDYFNSIDKKHLNCLATSTSDKSGYMSKETCISMSKSRTGIKRPIGFIERLRIINIGSKRSDISKKKMSLSQTGKKRSIDSRIKQSLSGRGRFVSDETKEKMRLNNGTSKKVKCLETGIIYNSLLEYCKLNNEKYTTIWTKLKTNKQHLKIKYYE